MFCLNDTMRYFLCPGKTDMRKGMSSLCGVIHERMGQNIKHGDVFIFIASDKKLMKLLHAEDGGLVIFAKYDPNQPTLFDDEFFASAAEVQQARDEVVSSITQSTQEKKQEH